MNFQFSGSIPNVHWQNNGNTMSSQPVTEFTILNGRVTLTRATNDTRNDVNVTIVANGRRNEGPQKPCVCKRTNRQIRWRSRRKQDSRSILQTVQQMKDHLNKSTDELSAAKKRYYIAKEEIAKAEHEMYEKACNARNAGHEMMKAVNDLTNPELYPPNDEEMKVVRFNLFSSKGDLTDVENDTKDVEKELGKEIILEFKKSTNDMHSETGLLGTVGSDLVNPSVGVTNFAALDSVKKCAICLVNGVNSVFYKCGHMCTCYDCAVILINNEYKKCPVCRSAIGDIVKIYIS